MRHAGIFGSPSDPHVQRVTDELQRQGARVSVFDPFELEREVPVSELDGQLTWAGHDTEALVGCYLCSLPAEVPSHDAGNDWFVELMRQRERAAFVSAFVLDLQARGTRLVNPLHAGNPLQFKPFQLNVLRRLGARVPATLISNDPASIRTFASQHATVIFKPLTGGAATRLLDATALARLDDVSASPCIFQARIEGDDVRVTLVDGEVLSAVAIRTPKQHLDYREDDHYARGEASYEPVTLPPTIIEHCRDAARGCGLVLTGIDLKRSGDDFVFLELNSSPIYADIEAKTGHPISAAIARAVLGS